MKLHPQHNRLRASRVHRHSHGDKHKVKFIMARPDRRTKRTSAEKRGGGEGHVRLTEATMTLLAFDTRNEREMH